MGKKDGSSKIKTDDAPQAASTRAPNTAKPDTASSHSAAADLTDKAEASRHQLLEYLKRVEDMLDKDQLPADAEERDIFVSNVLQELQHNVYRTCCDLVCSRVLEKLFNICSAEHVAQYARLVTPYMKDLALNRCGSHVLQAMIGRVLKGLAGYDASEDYADPMDELIAVSDPETPSVTSYQAPETPPSPLPVYFLKFCILMLEDVGTFIESTHGGHVLAQCISVLAGINPPQQNRSKASRNYRENTHTDKQRAKGPAPEEADSHVDVPATFLVMLQQMADTCMSSVRVMCLSCCDSLV
jgi:hypothetical protein